MFEDGAIVNRFIEGWRQSGEQRFGYLIGRYTEFNDVPLGIRAVVSAIYEPPQVRGGGGGGMEGEGEERGRGRGKRGREIGGEGRRDVGEIDRERGGVKKEW